MENPIEQTVPQETPQAPPDLPTEPEHRNALGPIVGIVVIVIIIVLGGYYIWNTQIRNGTTIVETETVTPEDTVLVELQDQDTSDSLSAIEGDLGDTDLDMIDQELADLEAELNVDSF